MQLPVRHGEPLLFGKERNRGLQVAEGGFGLEAVTLGEHGITVDDIVVHDETNRSLAMMLAALKPPDFPMAIGVIYRDPTATFDDQIHKLEPRGGALEDVHSLLRKGRTWEVL